MTKKRYIKLLMSDGMSIREARLRALMDISIYKSYSYAHLIYNSPWMKAALEFAINDVFGSALAGPLSDLVNQCLFKE